MIAHRKDLSAGIFWMNPSETWIDIVKQKPDAKVRICNEPPSTLQLTGDLVLDAKSIELWQEI